MSKYIALFFCFIFLTFILNTYATEQVSSAEVGAKIVTCGLSSSFQKSYLEAEDQLYFNPGARTITFWSKINVSKPEEFIIQRIEWYSPDGKIWLEESQAVSDAAYSKGKNPIAENGLVLSTIDTTQIPSDLQGIWCVRAYFNNEIVAEKYFTYGSEKTPPSESQILNAKEKIIENEKRFAAFDIKPADHFSSYLSADADGFLEKQRIIRPDIFFTPTDTIVYTLNADRQNMSPGWCPTLRLFIISPEGKKHVKFNETIFFSPVSDRVGHVQQKINLKSILGSDYKEKGLEGLWKLDFFYLDTGASVDYKYFYIREGKTDKANPKDIEDLDNKIGEDAVFDKYLDFFEKNMALDGRKKNEVIVKQMNENAANVKEVLKLSSIAKGTDKERILKEKSAPQTILKNKSGNEVWIYWREDKWSRSKSAAGTINRSHMATHSSNVGAGIAGAIIGSAIEGLTDIPTGELTKVYFTKDKIEEIITSSNVYITDVK